MAGTEQKEARRVILMGVAGCGKSSVGQALAAASGWRYEDGDDLHPPENIRKMNAGLALDDADRWPWLERIGHRLQTARGPLVLGCSALKRSYRDLLRERAGAPVLFVHLDGAREVIAARMAERAGHFMPSSLLASQFDDLEPPAPDELAITVDIDQPLDAVVAEIARRIPRAS